MGEIEKHTGFSRDDLNVQVQRGNYRLYSINKEPEYIIRVFHNNINKEVQQKFISEAHMLDSMHQIREIPTPQLIQSHLSDPQILILVMEKLQGVPLHEMWNYISRDQKQKIAGNFGEMLRELHQVEQPGYGRPDQFEDNWKNFIAQRIYQNLDHLSTHLDNTLIEKIHLHTNKWLGSVSSGQPVIIHGDLNAHNILIASEEGEPVISGIVDWEWSFAGNHLYDLVEIESLFYNSEIMLNAFYHGYGSIPKRTGWNYERKIYLLDRFLQTSCYYISTNTYSKQQQHLTTFMLTTILK